MITSRGSGNNSLWHQRYGHLNFLFLSLLTKDQMVISTPQIQEQEDICAACFAGKYHRLAFEDGKAWRAKAELELLHGDIYDPMRTLSVASAKYFLLLDEVRLFPYALIEYLWLNLQIFKAAIERFQQEYRFETLQSITEDNYTLQVR